MTRLNYMGPYWTIPGHTVLYWTILEYTRLYLTILGNTQLRSLYFDEKLILQACFT